MTTKTPKALPAKDAPSVKDQSALLARAALDPRVGAAGVVQAYPGPLGAPDFWQVAGALRDDMRTMAEGDAGEIEQMLLAQAKALQAIFCDLACRAASQDQMRHLEMYLRLGLKAQSQSRATLEALGELRNPRQVAFVRQANIAHGAQQVNNGSASVPEAPPAAEACAPAKNSETAPSELLVEMQDGERLDFSATRKAGAGDSDVAPVGALDRAAYG